MKILVISSFLPYPLFSGGHVRLYNLLKELSRNHSLTLICERRDNQTEADIKEIEKICKKVVTVDRKRQWSPQNILKTGVSPYPFLMIGHSSSIMKEKIDKELSLDKFDVLHIETFYVFQNLPKVSIPMVLVEHNIEYLVYQRYAQNAPIFLRPFLFFDVMKMKYWEKKNWKKATKLVAVSEEEKKLMEGEDVAVVPNGVDVQKYQISNIKYQISKKEKKILFIGDFKWIQNRDAVEWILKDIWPKITFNSQLSTLNLKLWIVGRHIPDSIKDLTIDPDVIFDQNAPEDTAEIFRQADILLAPIRIGGGTSFKILEAMASGVPVVTTLLGIEGIKARNGQEVIIAEGALELAKRVVNVLEDEDLYRNIALNARRLVEEKYDWKIIVRKLEEVYQSVI